MTPPSPRSSKSLPLPRWRPPAPRLSPLHLSDGIRAGEGRGDRHVLSRALCRFRWVPYGEVPDVQRRGYVRVQLLAWAPFDDSGYAVVDGRDGVMAFAWDRQAFEQRAAAAGLPGRGVRVLPETLLLPMLDDGVALRRCTEGVDAQVWRGGQLGASRWWAQPPDAAAWLNFQRSAGVPPSLQRDEVPTLAAEPEWRDTPWARALTLDAMIERSRLRTHALAALVLTLLLLPTLWLGHRLWAESQQLSVLAAEKAQLEARAQPILAARSEALAALATVDAWAAAVARPDALQLLQHLAGRLPADGSRIRNLEWDGPRLRLVLAVPPATPRIAYVRALEGGGWLRNVREETQEGAAGTVALAAEIRGTAPAEAAVAAAARAPAAAAAPVASR
jgi:hypothetical protein